jgi:fatty acid desaturase
MISYPIEHRIAELLSIKVTELSTSEIQSLRTAVTILERSQKKNTAADLLFTLLPITALGTVGLINLLLLPQLFTGQTALGVFIASLIHGFVSYSWVIYGLHECAGHGPRLWSQAQTLAEKARFLIGFSTRFLMADPAYYRANHFTHHTKLGTEGDDTFTHAVTTARLIHSLLPFSGILYPNDYKVHMGGKSTDSQKLSMRLGGITALILTGLLCSTWGVLPGILIGFVFGPWVSFVLDRLRESMEHQLMPRDTVYGVREIGWTIFGQVIGGGPWGQPFHFSHHFSKSLPWYLQLRLARLVRAKLTAVDPEHPIVVRSSMELLSGFIKRQIDIDRLQKKLQMISATGVSNA